MYISLPCDSSIETFPNNTIPKFTIKLPKPLKVEENCLVGLTSASWPYTFDNVDGEEINMLGYRDSMLNFRSARGYIEGGYFSDIKEFLWQLTKK